MIYCHLATYMTRDRLTASDVARLTGLNRSTVAALLRQSATRIDLLTIERLCALFRCTVGDLFESVPSGQSSST